MSAYLRASHKEAPKVIWSQCVAWDECLKASDPRAKKRGEPSLSGAIYKSPMSMACQHGCGAATPKLACSPWVTYVNACLPRASDPGAEVLEATGVV